jgi:hypothetical protein
MPQLATADGRRIEPRQFSVYRMQAVSVQEYPAWRLRRAEGPVVPQRLYDVLVPVPFWSPGMAGAVPAGPLGFRQTTIDLAAHERLALWVDLHVPPQVFSGQYAGSIAVQAGRSVQRVSLRLRVLDFVLPETRPLPCVGLFEHQSLFRQFIRRGGGREAFVPGMLDANVKEVREGLEVMRQLMQLAHQHRLDLTDPTIRPVLKRDETGQIALNWNGYDNIVQPYLDGTAFADRMGVAAWAGPIRTDWPAAGDYAGDTERYQQTVQTATEQTVEHFRQGRMLEKLFFWPDAPTGEQAARGLGQLLLQAAPAVPVVCAAEPASIEGQAARATMLAPPGRQLQCVIKPRARTAAGEQVSTSPSSASGSLSAASAPAADEADETDLAGPPGLHPLAGEWLRPGDMPFVGTCAPPAEPVDVRVLPWLAMKLGCKGILLGDVLGWDQPGGTALPSTHSQRLFYAATGQAGGWNYTTDRIYASARLKRLRRGLQDMAYLWVLRRRGRAATAEDMRDLLVRYAGAQAAGDNADDGRLNGWVTSPTSWLTARRLLAEECELAVHLKPMDDKQQLRRQLEWRTLAEQCSQVRLERTASRVQLAADGKLRAELTLELHNELPRAVQVQLEPGPLPAGWAELPPEDLPRLLGPGQRTSVKLAFTGERIATGGNAKVQFPILLVVDGQRRGQWQGSIPLVLAGFTARRPVIDGKLDDWPIRPGNGAADFVALGRRGEPRGPADAVQAPNLPARQTLALALHDQENLYLAFRCEEPAMGRLSARSDNRVDYDELLAVGEDLLEVVLDPGRRARSPQELYHIVIKPNGIHLTERGIGALPEPGAGRNWAAGAVLAVGKQDKLWIVEMSIPLKSFGGGGEARTWGANFARVARIGGEASSWSGAVRHFYNPAELGTMYLVGPDQQLPLEK